MIQVSHILERRVRISTSQVRTTYANMDQGEVFWMEAPGEATMLPKVQALLAAFALNQPHELTGQGPQYRAIQWNPR